MPESDEWAETQFNKQIQVKGDLGERMSNAFKLALETNKKAIIIGSDCPKINPTIINQAAQLLDHKDIVIGPTYDGGYYLLGMKKAHINLFKNMTWSNDKVFENTIDRIKESNLSHAELERLSDLDNIQDLQNFPDIKSVIES